MEGVKGESRGQTGKKCSQSRINNISLDSNIMSECLLFDELLAFCQERDTGCTDSV